MSMTEPSEPTVGSTVEDATSSNAPDVVEAQDTAVAPEPSRISLDEYGGHVVSAKVDGEERDVPLSELRDGYMRQESFTKKTQELADQRKQLQPYEALASALERDPHGTLRTLSDAYGLSLDGSTQQADDGVDWESMDPQEREIATLRNEVTELRRNTELERTKARIEGEFEELETSYGEVNRREVASYAMQHNLSVTDAYKAMNFDSIRTERQKLEEERKALESKRDAQVVEHGGGTRSKATQPATSGEKLDVRGSFQAAMQQLTGGA